MLEGSKTKKDTWVKLGIQQKRNGGSGKEEWKEEWFSLGNFKMKIRRACWLKPTLYGHQMAAARASGYTDKRVEPYNYTHTCTQPIGQE